MAASVEGLPLTVCCTGDRRVVADTVPCHEPLRDRWTCMTWVGSSDSSIDTTGTARATHFAAASISLYSKEEISVCIVSGLAPPHIMYIPALVVSDETTSDQHQM